VNVAHVSHPICLLTGKLECYVKYVAAIPHWTHIPPAVLLPGWLTKLM